MPQRRQSRSGERLRTGSQVKKRAALGREAHAVDEAAGLRRADGRRVAPFDPRAGHRLFAARPRLSSVAEGGVDSG